ncbi:MAG: PUR family DNA/RNA-binding protein [Flavobacteriaceae bacterium]|nr:PUR family DNA/RNA-binding protein [Flavobacteriaceae bacterium]
MENQNDYNAEEIFSKALRAGRRTYFFDVRETKAGDYYLTITESKKFTNEDGTFYYKKHKIYLYKEDFAEFNSSLKETCDYIIENKGTEVISEKHDKDFESKKEKKESSEPKKQEEETVKEENVEEEKDFADVDFEDDDQ